MAAYNDLDFGVLGMKADMSPVRSVTTSHAQETIPFGQLLFTYNGDWSRTGLYKADTSTLVGDADLVALNSTVVTVNGVALAPVVYAVSHDATMAALVAAVQAAGYDAELTDLAGDNRTIQISKDFTTVVASAVTTLAAGQPTWVATASSQMVDRGIALFTQKEPGGYFINEAVSVALLGTYYVDVEVAVVEGDAAYYNRTTGRFTNVAGGNLDINSEFQSNTAINGIAKLSISYGI